MALTPLSDDLNIIAALHDEPNVDDGLTAAQLKAKFDESGNKIKTYINGTLKDFVEDLENGTGLADGSVTEPKLAANSVSTRTIIDGNVTTAKLDDEAVTTAKIDLNAVGKNQLALGCVDTDILASGAVHSSNIEDYQVLHNHLASNAVEEGNIKDGSVTESKLGSFAVTLGKIANSAVNSYKLATDAVTTAKIKDKNVTKAKLEDSVQTSLGKADTAYQKPGTGIPSSDMATAVQTSLGLADTALQSAHEVPSGGTSGQVLAKNSNTDYDLKWVNQSGGGGSSDYDDLTDKPSINSVTLSGNKTTSDLKLDQIFWATYGTTSASDIETAYQAGKTILCKYNGYVYTMMYRGSSSLFRFFAFNNGSNNAYYIACSSGTWTNGSVDFGPSLSDVAAKALGTASAGTSTTVSRSDHVHAKPSASDIGAVAVAQGVGHAGEFLVVGSDGNITTVTMSAWSAGSY